MELAAAMVGQTVGSVSWVYFHVAPQVRDPTVVWVQGWVATWVGELGSCTGPGVGSSEGWGLGSSMGTGG